MIAIIYNMCSNKCALSAVSLQWVFIAQSWMCAICSYCILMTIYGNDYSTINNTSSNGVYRCIPTSTCYSITCSHEYVILMVSFDTRNMLCIMKLTQDIHNIVNKLVKAFRERSTRTTKKKKHYPIRCQPFLCFPELDLQYLSNMHCADLVTIRGLQMISTRWRYI